MVELLFQIALVLVAAFMILIVLLQRGRGGGLAGAFGGMGGQSAFGAKAGDVFTRITVGTAILWILLCVLASKVLNRDSGPIATDLGGAQQTQPGASPGVDPLGSGDGTSGAAPSVGTTAPESGQSPDAPEAGKTPSGDEGSDAPSTEE